jgi:CubicO group peptidase (beta-lactamase class C family)
MGHGTLISPEPYPIHEAVVVAGFEPGPPLPSREPPTDEWMRRLGALPLIYQPGEQWLYHTGAEVAGVLISRATGRSLETFMRERIFEPLGMKDTAFSVPADKIDRFATSYWNDPGTGAFAVYDTSGGGAWSRPPAFESGGAGLVSSADDFAAFGQMTLNKGTYNGERILSRPSVELMTSNQITAEQAASSFFLDGHGWGLGMSVITRRDHVGPSVGAFGWNGGLGTSWYADPAEDMFSILLTQRAWGSPSPPTVLFDFITSAYQAIDD